MMATNSIIIANLPDWANSNDNSSDKEPVSLDSPTTEMLASTFLESLRVVIEVHRDIVHWVPVRSFRRVFCVFGHPDDAEIVKCALNGCIFEGHRLDVYYGENTPLTIEKKHLEPPVLQRNWLISPPGSPQEGWIQIEEDPPNDVTLHEDIQNALDRLAMELEQCSPNPEDAEDDKTKGHVILDTTGQGGVQVVVHDWDAIHNTDSDEDSDGEGEGRGLGGRGIGSVKATSLALGHTPRPRVEAELM